MERFWSKVDKTDNCWNWKANTGKFGYGRFHYNGRNGYAHIFSYELHNGPKPEGYFVLHNCDNPSCVNPSHLRLGTHADNMKDKSVRRRIHGERNPRAKLTQAQANVIRMDTRSSRQIAKEYGVEKSIILDIRKGVLWNPPEGMQ